MDTNEAAKQRHSTTLVRVSVPIGAVMAELIELDRAQRTDGDWYLVRFISNGFTGYVHGDSLLSVWEFQDRYYEEAL